MTLPERYNAKESEAKWQETWLRDRVYAWQSEERGQESETALSGVLSASKEASRGTTQNFVIDTPPPTVSGLLHMGHIFSYTQADFVARFQRMTGKNVFYPMGFDDNGLPTERLVEKVMKKRAVDMSREEFIALCEKVVAEAEEEFRILFKSIALSVDWDQEYQTISAESRKISQMSFLDLYKKERAYKQQQPMLWDPVDQTAIAQAEIEDKELPSFANDIPFGIVAEGTKLEDIKWAAIEKVTIMTTRPELLGACVALMCHPDDAEKYKGKKAVTPLFGVVVPIIADEKVDKEKGTGLVMCCTFGDETDILWWKKHNLPMRIVLNKYGKLELGVEWLESSGRCGCSTLDSRLSTLNGLKVSNADPKHPGARQKIMEILQEFGCLLAQKPITHAVKCAERSGAPVEYLPTSQWFVKILDQKEQLKEKARQCVWRPEYMRIRIEQWIDGLNWDWCISRQRYFGVPFPVWYVQGAEDREQRTEIVVASAEQLPVNPLVDVPLGYTLHERKEGLLFATKDSTGEAVILTPDYDVMDTWATSSVSPQLSSKGINRYFNPLSRERERVGVRAIEWKNSKEIIENARNLRKNSTDAEALLWSCLRDRQLEDCKFRRQHALEKYIADFACIEAGLIIELDGGQHNAPATAKKDQIRTLFLEKKEFRILRFWNNDVLDNIEGVLQEIVSVLQESKVPSPLPLPLAGEGKKTLTPPSPVGGRGQENPFVIDAARHQQLFPADLRPQAHEIIRTWAFYTIVKAHLHEDTIPWKNLMISGWCLASDKTKMSKSKGNVITPTSLIEEKGSDAVRYWASTSRLGADTAFSEDVLKIGNKLVNKLWNAAKLCERFQVSGFRFQDTQTSNLKPHTFLPLDRWILTRLTKAIEKATAEFGAYEYCAAREYIEDFFWKDFCDNYLEMVKVRAYGEGPEAASAHAAIALCLEAVLRLFAPFVPHITEELYQNMFAPKRSIHARGMWPEADAYFIDEVAEKSGIAAIQVLDAVRAIKAEKKISIKWPFAELVLSEGLKATLEPVLFDLKAVTNAESLRFAAGEGLVVGYTLAEKSDVA